MNAHKTGYLEEAFRAFYLTTTKPRDFLSHYHDFHKLLLFESGSVSYYVEGETYQLLPYDIVLVPAGEVHRPVIYDNSPYRRLIVYFSPAFFEHFRQNGFDLFSCFAACTQKNSHVLRTQRFRESRLYAPFRELIQTLSNDEHVSLSHSSDAHHTQMRALYQQSLLTQILILLSQMADGSDLSHPAASGANPQVLQILAYINAHLTEELSVDAIAASCYLNRSYLMHLFRRETGYTLGSYITEKRLFAARTLIQNGISVTDACLQSGFSGYTAFYRAYRKKFGEPPKDARTVNS